MALLEWRGSEIRVFDAMRPTYWLVVTGLSITSYEADHESSRAFGEIMLYDYQAQCFTRVRWQATRPYPTWENLWEIYYEPFEEHAAGGRPQVAWTDELMGALDGELGRMLSDFAALGRIDIDEPVPYEGTCPEGIGPCVCAFLKGHHAYNEDEPTFAWYDFTKGRAPRRCFRCGCGRRWWQFDPDIDEWREVADVEAWDMLVAHNGVPVKAIWFDRQDRVHLVSTMIRDKIPMVERPGETDDEDDRN